MSTEITDFATYTGLCAGRLYTPRTLMTALGIGRSKYQSMMNAGMPHAVIARRYFFSGTLIIQWVEEASTDTNRPHWKRTAKKPVDPSLLRKGVKS